MGTPRLATDKSGNVVWQADYATNGEATLSSNNQITSNLRFPGQYFDVESNLHYNTRRFYDPKIGRYITQDPIGFNGGLNLYNYVGGDPINNADPTGEILPAIAMGLGFLGGSLWEIGVQMVMNGGNWDCIDWLQVGMSGVSSMSFGGRLGYKATIAGIKSVAKTGEEAYAMRKAIKHEYRLVDPIRKVLEKRDPPIEKIRDPLGSSGKSNWKWDLGIVTPGATSIGLRTGNNIWGEDSPPKNCGCY